jgi:hypothetical protein
VIGAALLCLLGVTDAHASIRIKSPTMSPAFRPAARDYAVTCSQPVQVRVNPRGGSEARIGREPWSGAAGEAEVALTPDQALRVHTRRPAGGKRTYTLRCTPEDFPDFEFTREGRPAAPFYLITPESTGPPAVDGGYAVVVTRWGAPIWWRFDTPSPFDAKVLPDGTFAWHRFGGGYNLNPEHFYVLRRPSGRTVGEVRTVGSPTDEHDLQLTADGNYMLISYVQRDGVDTSQFNGDSDASIYDCVVQVVAPDGTLVSEWSTADHIGLGETPAYRWDLLSEEPYDTTHMNAVEPLVNGDFLVSLRHTDAVYRIDGDTGAIEWKLGGSTTPQSLAVEDDPMSPPLQAQHDVRWLGHHEISVHDNGDGEDRAARVVRYRIGGGVARLEESFTDDRVPPSACCGSARKVDDDWLVAWGGTPWIAEYDSAHSPVFTIELLSPGTSYRAVPIQGELSGRELRRGMDVQARSD